LTESPIDCDLYTTGIENPPYSTIVPPALTCTSYNAVRLTFPPPVAEDARRTDWMRGVRMVLRSLIVVMAGDDDRRREVFGKFIRRSGNDSFVCETMERSKRRRLNPKDVSDEEEEFE
jgi:hypothetical protein